VSTLADNQIENALDCVKRGLDSYLKLQREVRSCNARTDEEFQKSFNGFYRVRRNAQWRAAYFDLLESAKVTGIDFARALREINERTRKIEASFASKLVATLDPSKPVIDKFVLQYFKISLPRWGSPERELKTVDLYHLLCENYQDLMQSPTGTLIRELFDSRYPSSGVTELKKTDFVLWQLRP
jgi:hypothetical protein